MQVHVRVDYVGGVDCIALLDDTITDRRDDLLEIANGLSTNPAVIGTKWDCIVLPAAVVENSIIRLTEVKDAKD